MSRDLSKESIRRIEILDRLRSIYPGSARELCALDFSTNYQLLVATILSAQCTDERVNATTPKLFSSFPSPDQMSEASVEELERLVYSTGFYKNKARNILEMSKALLDRHCGVVPSTMEELVALPGVGRKTANVVLSVAFAKPGLPVDTHVRRLARRLGLSRSSDPVAIEHELMVWVPPEESGSFSIRLILHGRNTCQSRLPKCASCVLADLCPSVTVGAL